ncbi:MAG: AI-2E family transporter [Terracidiphilus sp.]
MTQSSGNEPTHRGDIVFFFALAAAGYVAWLARDVLTLLYVSALFAVVVNPIVRFVGHLHIGRWQPFRGFAILYLLLAALAGIVGFGFLAIPPVVRDLQSFGGEMPGRLPSLLLKLVNLPILDQLNAAGIGAKVQDFLSTAVGQLLVSMKNWAGALFSILTGVVLTIYFILDGKLAYRWFLSFFPAQRRERLDLALRRANVRMGKWLLGQGSLMLVLGLSSTLVFVLLHVRYPYALGVLTGTLNLIPVLGAVISISIAVLVAAIDSWGRVLGVAIFFFVYIWLENSLLTPRIMKNRVDLPSLGILVALLLGFDLGGIPGAMVAIPTAVLVAVLVDEYLVQKE